MILMMITKDKGWHIRLETHTNIETASKALESSYFDGAIIDMKLADSGNEGNQALDVIRQHFKTDTCSNIYWNS